MKKNQKLFNYKIILLSSLILLFLNGCFLSMEPSENILNLNNNSDQKIEILLNLSYPDSSLYHCMNDRYIDPKSSGYLGSTLPLKSQDGITVILFNFDYVKSKWHENVGRPDSYLEEDKILKRFVLSKSQLDSLNWTIAYP